MKKIIITFLLTFLSFTCLFAQDIKILTIEDAVSLSLQNNMSIKQSKMDLDLLALKNKYSWNSVSPSLTANVNFTEPVKKFDQWNLTATGTLSLSITPSLATSIASAKLAYENGLLSYEATVRSVEKNVRSAFYSLLNDLETINSDKKTLDAAKRTYDSNLIKYNRGQLDQLTLLTSQYNYESKIPTVAADETAYQTSLDSLKQVLGIDLSQQIEINGNLDDILHFELDPEILNKNVDELPDVKKALQTIKNYEISIKGAKLSAYGPTVSLSYSQGFSSSAFSGVPKLSNENHNITLGVRIPLDSYLPWSNSAISIEQAESGLEAAKLTLENTRTSVKMTIRNTYNSILEAQTQLKLCEANLELMQKTYDLTLLAYNSGSKDLSVLQTAADNLATSRRNIQRQKYIIINSVLNLENVLGLPFGSFMKK
jgi:outer membrane protein TolC